ncbi:MAG TPA: hypothetical protein VMX94_00635 [Armatimonadota bacterium]|nr:hypothetical protein [Armatimonadota bacterium]
MKQYEYRTHYLALKPGKPNEEQLIDTLNAFGKEGWRLNRLYAEISLRSLASLKGGVGMLLEREA